VTVPSGDVLLKRLERSALVFCVVAAGVALGVRRGHPDVALGILGGGLLIAVSYWAIKGATDSLLRLATRPAPTGPSSSGPHGADSRAAAADHAFSRGPGARAQTGSSTAGVETASDRAADAAATGEDAERNELDGGTEQSRLSAVSAAWILLRLAGRYALLGFLAYAMIARLRLHPVGLLIGVSSAVAAAAAEALRQLSAGVPGPRAGGHPPDG
jgi:hypothetical protein